MSRCSTRFVRVSRILPAAARPREPCATAAPSSPRVPAFWLLMRLTLSCALSLRLTVSPSCVVLPRLRAGLHNVSPTARSTDRGIHNLLVENLRLVLRHLETRRIALVRTGVIALRIHDLLIQHDAPLRLLHGIATLRHVCTSPARRAVVSSSCWPFAPDEQLPRPCPCSAHPSRSRTRFCSS